jgi:RND family efflux transporter MFP subunit
MEPNMTHHRQRIAHADPTGDGRLATGQSASVTAGRLDDRQPVIMQTGGRRPATGNAGRRASLLAVALMVVGVGSVMGCKKKTPAPTADAQATAAAANKGPVAAQFAKVETRKLPRALEVSGTLDPDERSEVASPGSGTVLKVNIDVGSRVKKGDVLVELDGRESSLRLAGANATTQQQLARLGIKPGDKFDADATPEVRAAKEARDLAISEAERMQALFDRGAVTQQQLDQAKSGAERARAQYDAARNGADQAWAGLLAAQAQAGLSSKAVGDSRIRAPFEGSVVEKRVSPGEFANTGRVVAVLVDDNPLRFRFDVPEADVGGIEVGRPVELSVAAHPGKIFKAEVKRVGASINAKNRTLPVEAEIANDDGKLRAGFFAKARIALEGEATESLLVPKAAVGQTGSSARVFVRSGTRVSERLVTLGREVDGMVEVRGQLAATDEVAIEAVDQLSDGAAVAPR